MNGFTKQLPLLVISAVCLLSAISLPMGAQTPDSTSFRFDVATIRPSDPAVANSNLNLNEDGLSAKNVPIDDLLKFAYGLNSGSDDQIVGAPGWTRTARFDIDAKEEQTTALAIRKMLNEDRDKAFRAMLQKLLAERFSLIVHTEMQPHLVAALEQSKGGAKLKPFTECAATNQPCDKDGWQGLHNDGHGHIYGRGATVGMLADVLASQTEIGGRMVVDKTGLSGKYQFDLRWNSENSPGQAAGISLFSALEEQLGLKLKAEKLPIKVLVIDQMSRPSEN